jgi:mono/diheme cytochrome c family protein
MLKHLLLTALVAAFSANMGYAADQSIVKIMIPVEKTSPVSGRQMFTSYCAPCHGVDGRGHGPAATALRTAPADLTGLSRKNHGSFPDTHIVAVLQFGTEIPSHGSPQMPVWGPILSRMNMSNVSDKELRISNLSNYIQSIQQR